MTCIYLNFFWELSNKFEHVSGYIYRDSSDYSDWCVDTSSNLQPPKRKSTRIKKRKRLTSSDESDSDGDTVDTQNSGSRSVSREGSQTRTRGAGKKPDKQQTKKKKKGQKVGRKFFVALNLVL